MKKEIIEPEIHKINVQSWSIKDTYPCPKCGVKLSYPKYTCEIDNIKVQPMMKMKF